MPNPIDKSDRGNATPSRLDLFQKTITRNMGVPPDLVLASVNGGNAIQITIKYRDNQLKSIAGSYRIYYLDATHVSSTQLFALNTATSDNQGRVNYTGFFDAQGKKQWVIDIPNIGSIGTATVLSAAYVNGGWFFAVPVDGTGKQYPMYCTAPVPVPVDAAGSAAPIPAYEVSNPQVSLTPYQANRGYADHVFCAYQSPSPLGSFAGVTIFIQNYFNSGSVPLVAAKVGVLEEIGFFQYNSSVVGGQGVLTFNQECDDGSGGGAIVTAHDCIIYFVATSKSMAHRPDITNAPSVYLVGGFKNQMTAPIAPGIDLTAVGPNHVELTWQEIGDQTIDHYNIYRANQGRFSNPVVNGQPTVTYATITRDLINAGKNSWVDHQFNMQVTPGSDAPQHIWSPNAPVPPHLQTPDDFNIADFAIFEYWLAATNMAGQTGASTAILAFLRGNQGQDNNPGATYRDNTLNCVWNAQFNSVTAGAALTVTAANQGRVPPAPNGALGLYTYAVTAATNATPIVVTTAAQSPQFVTGQTVFISGVTGNTAANDNGRGWIIRVTTPGTIFSLNGSTGNGAFIAGGTASSQPYQAWTSNKQGTAVLPTFVTNGSFGTGEVDIPPVTSTGVGDFNTITQDTPQQIYLPNESIAVSVYAGYATTRPNIQSVVSTMQVNASGTTLNQIFFFIDNSTLNNVASDPTTYVRYWAYGVIGSPVASLVSYRMNIFQRYDNVHVGAGTLRVKQPMINGGTEVATWTANCRIDDAPGQSGAAGTGGGGTGGGNNASGGDGCPCTGTMIMTPSCDIPVELLKPGMKVVSYSRRFGPTESTVDTIEERGIKLMAFVVVGDRCLTASYSHPIATSGLGRFFKRMERVRVGQSVYVMDRKFALLSTEKVLSSGGSLHPFERSVWKIHLKNGPKTYFANGILSHNKHSGFIT